MLNPTPEQMVEMHAALDRAGVPHEFRRYQEPLIWEPQYDIVWQRFAVEMWKRSYSVALHAIKVLEQRVCALKKEQWETPMTFFYPDIDG